MAQNVLCRAIGVAPSGLLIERWNDAPERTFADVKGAFCRAIDAARAAEGLDSTPPAVPVARPAAAGSGA